MPADVVDLTVEIREEPEEEEVPESPIWDREEELSMDDDEDGRANDTGGEVSWKPVGTSWVNCMLWITFPPMYPPITFGAHLECNLNI